MRSISVESLHKELQQNKGNVLFVDVRTPIEREDQRIQGTINIPMDRIHEQTDLLKKYDRVYVHCASGGRSQKVCMELGSIGLENVVNVEGGIRAWEAVGLGTLSSRRGLSILQQVHLTVGALVLLGIALSFYTLWFIALPVFLACGLILSGLTGICGLSHIFIRMPWNRS